MTSQKRDPYQDSDKHGLFPQKVATALYKNAQFAISSACPLSLFRSVSVLKFEKDQGECNVHVQHIQNKRTLKSCVLIPSLLQPVNVFKQLDHLSA